MFESKEASRVCTFAGVAIAAFSLFFSQSAIAQTSNDNPAPGSVPAAASNRNGHEFYISWGYNSETYRPVDLRMSQPTLENEFTLHNVGYHDSEGWTTGLLSHTLTGPQYNFKLNNGANFALFNRSQFPHR
jgi:hypothetical protein